MPLLFYGPGGGGAGGNGYKYQSKGVVGLSYGRNADGSLTLNWSDPEDGAPASEWKGTAVVCKEGEPPKSVDDGEVVCESAVKNQYRDSGLVLDVGGPGYYYGVFPYTKDGVVNTDGENVVYIPNAGYDTSLENASWSDIAHISSQGIADQVWSVGDEIDLVLSGDYNGAITMQIAGFNHDDLVSGGKAGITFLSKQVLAGIKLSQSNCYGWTETDAHSTIMPKLRASLPLELQTHIKKILKMCENGKHSEYNHTIEDNVFVPSISEIEPRSNSGFLSAGSVLITNNDGVIYDIFKNSGGVTKSALGGGDSWWWTRSAYNYDFVCISAEKTKYINLKPSKSAYGVCFGFCI